MRSEARTSHSARRLHPVPFSRLAAMAALASVGHVTTLAAQARDTLLSALKLPV